jgi:hypothetical protein
MPIKYRYLIFIWGDVEPEARGPYPTDEARVKEARELRKEHGPEHGIYGADVLEDGKLNVWAYSGAFFDE